MKPGIGNYLSILAALGMALPLNTLEAGDQTPSSVAKAKVITDVSLSPEGDLLGAVVHKDGRPIKGQSVHVLAKHIVIASAKTDAKGRYRIRGLRNGIHQVKIAGQEQVCRIWAPKTAPPSCQRGLITTNDGRVVRGQDGDSYALGGADLVGLAIFGGATAVTLVSTLGASDSDVSGSGLGSAGGSGNNDSAGSGDPASP